MKERIIILLFAIVFICFLSACGSYPDEDYILQTMYNDSYIQHTTTELYTQPSISQTEKSNDKSTVKTVEKISKKPKKTKLIVNFESDSTLKTKITNVVSTGIEEDNITTVNTQITTTTTLSPLLDTDLCYITAKGERYHRQGCGYLKRSCIEIIVGDAKEKGYTPCKVCKP